jgi:hypothetical protein
MTTRTSRLVGAAIVVTTVISLGACSAAGGTERQDPAPAPQPTIAGLCGEAGSSFYSWCGNHQPSAPHTW